MKGGRRGNTQQTQSHTQTDGLNITRRDGKGWAAEGEPRWGTAVVS